MLTQRQMAEQQFIEIHRKGLSELHSRIPDSGQINEHECRFRDFSNRYSFSKLFHEAKKRYGTPRKIVSLVALISSNDELGNQVFNNHLLTIDGLEAIRTFLLTGQTLMAHTSHSTKVVPRLVDWQDQMLLNYNIKQGVAIETKFGAVSQDFLNAIKSSALIKLYRYKVRYQFITTKGHFLDMTVVKQATGRNPAESELTNQAENYEVELEYNNEIAQEAGQEPGEFAESLMEVLKIANQGWIKMTKQASLEVAENFRQMVFGSNGGGPPDPTLPPSGADFIAPNVVPLTADRLAEDPTTHRVPIDQIQYLLTDKADGQHHLLFIDQEGYIYLINSNFQISDCEQQSQTIRNSLVDGEIVETKDHQLLFLGFDILFDQEEDIRYLQFTNGRYDRLKNIMDDLRSNNSSDRLSFEAKTYLPWTRNSPDAVLRFYHDDGRQVSDRYPLDGLILLPAREPYPQVAWGKSPRWRNLLKYKPASHQTVDFYLKFSSQRTVIDGQQYLKATPCSYKYNSDRELTYPPFEPGVLPNTPGDPTQVFIPLSPKGVPQTLEGEFIYDQMVVECGYNHNLGWYPMRCRYDKSQREKNGQLVAIPNEFGVAQSNWQQIVNPVLLAHLLGRQQISRLSQAYYEDPELKPLSERLRGLHNLIKDGLIRGAVRISRPATNSGSVQNQKVMMLDVACGRLGDLIKWTKAGITHVLGTDINESNFTQEGGAEDRIREAQRSVSRAPRVWLAVADMTKPIDDASAALNEASRQQLISTYREIGGLYQFNIVSCQFAIHYATQTEQQIRTVFRNAARNLRMGGVFVGTTFDGERLYQLLKDAPNGQIEMTKEIKDVGKVVLWSIKRNWPVDQPLQNVGQQIEVYNSWISTASMTEYLVNFNFLSRLAEEYGLTPIGSDHSQYFDFIDFSRPYFDDITQDFQLRVMPPATRESYVSSNKSQLFTELGGRSFQEVYPAEGAYSRLSRVFAYVKVRDTLSY